VLPSQLGYDGTLTAQWEEYTNCQWEDEMVRERTGHPPSYAAAKKMKSVTLHTHGCLRTSLRDCSSSFNNEVTRGLPGRQPPNLKYYGTASDVSGDTQI